MKKEHYLLAKDGFMENKIFKDNNIPENVKNGLSKGVYTNLDKNTMLYSTLTGSKSYGLDIEGSDDDYYMFYLPSKKDLIYKKKYPFEYHNNKENYSVKFKDIVDLVSLCKKTNIQVMELIVFDKEIYNGEEYLNKLFDYLYNNKDELLLINETRLIESIYGNIYQRYLGFKRDFENKEDCYAKSYMHFYRYGKYLDLLVEGNSIYEGVFYTGNEREKLISYRQKPLSDGEELLENMEDELKRYFELKSNLLKLAKPFNEKIFLEFSNKVEECVSSLIAEYIKF